MAAVAAGVMMRHLIRLRWMPVSLHLFRVPWGCPLSQVRRVAGRGSQLSTSLLADVLVHVVAARLGHADPAITLRVYAHVIRRAEAAAADIFAQAVTAA